MSLKDEDNPLLNSSKPESSDPKSNKNLRQEAAKYNIFCAKSKKSAADGVNIVQHAVKIVDADGHTLFASMLYLSEEWSRYYADREHPVTFQVRKLNFDPKIHQDPIHFRKHFKELFEGFEFKPADPALVPTSVPSQKEESNSNVVASGNLTIKKKAAPPIPKTAAKVPTPEPEAKPAGIPGIPGIPGIKPIEDVLIPNELVKASTFTKKEN